MARQQAPPPSLLALLLLLGGALVPAALGSHQQTQVVEDVNLQAGGSSTTSLPLVHQWQQSTDYTGSSNSESSDKNSRTPADSSNSSESQQTLSCTARCPLCPTCPAAPTCPTPCRACPTCRRIIPPGYEHFPGLGHYRLHNVPVVWMEAKKTCEREGAHLAIINSQEEANLFVALFSRDPKIGQWLYLGFHDLYQEGTYVTILGEPLSKTGYTSWERGQPDNFKNNENCGSMFPSGGINDLNCESKQPFVCELPV